MRRLVLIAVAFLASCVACKSQRAQDLRYELPADYEGWVWVEWDVVDAPAFETDKVTRELVVKVPPSAYARTSTKLPKGFSVMRWMYPDSTKVEPQARRITYVEKDLNGRHRVLESFYVGPGPAPLERPTPPAP